MATAVPEAYKQREEGTTMDAARLSALAEDFLAAWNSQEVERVVRVYTDDVVYRDPNTRGDVRGGDALRRYLTKLFAGWQMHWSLREAFPLAREDGAAVLWHASFRRPDGDRVVEADGMDLVLVRGDRISRNEVYFDRAVLASLLGA
jgi:ketosteroid isomerase-like protein